VYRLDPGRVVIERDDFALGVRYRRLDAIFEFRIADRRRQRLVQGPADCRLYHVTITSGRALRQAIDSHDTDTEDCGDDRQQHNHG
jgi:hypothetical protein